MSSRNLHWHKWEVTCMVSGVLLFVFVSCFFFVSFVSKLALFKAKYCRNFWQDCCMLTIKKTTVPVNINWTYDKHMNLEMADINITEFNLGTSWGMYYYIKVLMQMKRNEQECFWKLLMCCQWFTSNLGGAIINLVELSITEVEIQWVCILK